ncbi:MAG: transposase [Psychrobacter sp.]|nr:transposase [Psychrobacter sp.]MDN6307977.1 transposase [Psychrobacter sp.]
MDVSKLFAKNDRDINASINIRNEGVRLVTLKTVGATGLA